MCLKRNTLLLHLAGGNQCCHWVHSCSVLLNFDYEMKQEASGISNERQFKLMLTFHILYIRNTDRMFAKQIRMYAYAYTLRQRHTNPIQVAKKDVRQS